MLVTFYDEYGTLCYQAEHDTLNQAVSTALLGGLLAGCLLSDLNLSNLTLAGTTFYNNRFNNSNLRNAKLTNCTFESCFFSHTDLTGADLSGCRFIHCSFKTANLHRTRWRGAILDGGRFVACATSGADFTGVDLTGIFTDRQTFRRAIGVTVRRQTTSAPARFQEVPNTWHSANHPGKRLVITSKRFAGVEIEVAGDGNGGGWRTGGNPDCECGECDDCARYSGRLPTAVTKWGGSIVEDGSLPDGGYEINTAPAAGDMLAEQIRDICTELGILNAFVTKACGLHVHVDCRDLSYYDIRRLTAFYAFIEPVLFGMVPLSRQNNTYCRPCGERLIRGLAKVDKHQARKDTMIALYGGTDRSSHRSKYDSSRYAALNVHSWFFRGTIECRLMSGSVKEEKILAWASLWCYVVDWLVASTDDDIQQIIEMGNPVAALVWGPLAAHGALQRWVGKRLATHAKAGLPRLEGMVR